MRAPLALLLLAAGSLVLAGCLGPSSPPPPQQPERERPARVADDQPSASAPASPEPVQQYVVFPYNGKLTVGAGAGGVGYVTPLGSMEPHGTVFPVEEGAVAIVAEMRWKDPVSDLDFEVGAPDCDTTTAMGHCFFANGGSPGAGDSPVRTVVSDPAALTQSGDWLLVVWAKDAVNTEYQVVVTVFYGAAPTDDYTAFDDS